MDSTGSKENAKLSISIVSSLLIAAVVMTLISMELLPLWMSSMLIPVFAYGISVLMSIIYQYSACKTVNLSAISSSNLFIALTNAVVSGVLFLEGIPVLKYIFGDYAPRNPITGLPYDASSAEYTAAMETENHYKLQFFSGIVKAVLPAYISEQVKSGFVYFYWIFWLTILPLYFILSVQGLC
jgi:hypothetical protein